MFNLLQFLAKTIISALIIATVSVVSKKVPLIGAIIISLPITSILALIWLYVDTKDSGQIVQLSNSITLMLVPSFIFFIALSILLKNNMSFPWALVISCGVMIIAYSLYTFVLGRFGIK